MKSLVAFHERKANFSNAPVRIRVLWQQLFVVSDFESQASGPSLQFCVIGAQIDHLLKGENLLKEYFYSYAQLSLCYLNLFDEHDSVCISTGLVYVHVVRARVLIRSV